MALSTYTGLQASIASWLMRDDLTDYIPDFISLAESDMNQRLRLRSMLTTVTIAAAGADLPADCLEVKSVHLDNYGHLEFGSLAENANFVGAYRGGPAYLWGIDGNAVVVSPTQTSDDTLTVRYYARVPALSAEVPTNVFLTASPALYLYGSLVQSAPFLGDDARMQVWGSMYTQAAEAVQNADDVAEYPGPLVVRASQW
jgi:hypothetical protein